jgi:hypothetical protein
MSKEALAKVVQRAISDAAFRRQLNTDPAGALRGFDLSADEASAIRTGDAGRLSTLGVDQRMSKSFALGGALASTRMAASDLTPGGGPSMVDDASGATGKTVIPADPAQVASADASGGTGGTGTVRAGDDYKFAGRQAPDGGGTNTVRAGDDWKFADRVAPEGSGTVRTGDDWKFTDRQAAPDGATVRTGDDWKFADKNAGGGMANYPAHDGLAGPSGVSSVRAGDDWARSSAGIADSGRIGTARLDDATGGASGGANVIHDDPNGFLAANADAGGSVVRANVINDDPNGFLAANANADVTSGSAAPTDAFVDDSESYLTKVGYDASAASASADATVIHDDPDGFLAANADDSATDGGNAAPDIGTHTPS